MSCDKENPEGQRGCRHDIQHMWDKKGDKKTKTKKEYQRDKGKQKDMPSKLQDNHLVGTLQVPPQLPFEGIAPSQPAARRGTRRRKRTATLNNQGGDKQPKGKHHTVQHYEKQE